MVENKTQTVDQLNSFLRGEISAVETYRQALDKIKDQEMVRNLRECQQSHQQRVNLLSDRIKQLGGSPASGSGAWGSFTKLVTGGAAAFGDKAAIAALEEGEDHGIRDYKTDLSKLDPDSRKLVEQQILPAQQRTHQSLSNLKRNIEQRMA